jgi:cytoskeletal protein CcmA (bactofilin family)
MVLGKAVVVRGDLSCDGDLTVEGAVEGFVLVRDGLLVIGPHADILAAMRATRVLVQGRVRGAISASDRIELAPTAVVDGSLSASRIVLADGACFNGAIDMGQRHIAALVAEYRAAQRSS